MYTCANGERFVEVLILARMEFMLRAHALKIWGNQEKVGLL
jgi:hypothetical protein